MTLVAVSLLLFSRLGVDADVLGPAARRSSSAASGWRSTMTPTTAAAMGSVPVDKAGVGSAVLNSFRQVGGSLGIAVMGAIVASQVRRRAARTARRAVRRRLPRARSRSRRAIAFVGAVVAVVTVRTHRAPRSTHAAPWK